MIWRGPQTFQDDEICCILRIFILRGTVSVLQKEDFCEIGAVLIKIKEYPFWNRFFRSVLRADVQMRHIGIQNREEMTFLSFHDRIGDRKKPEGGEKR